MRFRPCIDIHNGKVKQIVGGSLADSGDFARENFVSDMEAADYAVLYKKKGLWGGHVILLNAKDSRYYEEDKRQAFSALRVWPGSLQVGGGITAGSAGEFLDAGASHVIVTSYVFQDGRIRYDRLEELTKAVGAEHLVLDLSCRKRDGDYYIVTDRWQKFTRQPLDRELIHRLSGYCDEFLVHAVNVEGTGTGVDEELLRLLSGLGDISLTYAGGIGSMEDIETIAGTGEGRVDFTVGSALDLFGGSLSFDEIITKFHN